MSQFKYIHVEVAYATPEKQEIIPLKLTKETSVYEAFIQSKLNNIFPEIKIETAVMGIFGKVIKRHKDHLLKDGDRVEIYRPLVATPRKSRKRSDSK